jgi:hypothetical protein
MGRIELCVVENINQDIPCHEVHIANLVFDFDVIVIAVVPIERSKVTGTICVTHYAPVAATIQANPGKSILEFDLRLIRCPVHQIGKSCQIQLVQPGANVRTNTQDILKLGVFVPFSIDKLRRNENRSEPRHRHLLRLDENKIT